MRTDYPFSSYSIEDPEILKWDSLPADRVWQILRRTSSQNNRRRYIYRYRFLDEEFLRQILVDSKLFLPSADGLNDPFDMRARVVLEGSPQERRAEYHEKFRTNHPEMGWVERHKQVDRLMADESLLPKAAAAFKNARDSTGVCSFASNPADIVMWSHYGDQHKGVCIQFERCQSPTRLLAAQQVTYEDEYPTINFAASLQPQLEKIVLHKSLHWSYEGEFRLVCPNDANTYFPFPPKAVTAVIVGCRASDKTFEFLEQCNQARERMNEPRFRIYKTVPSLTEYKLRIHPWRARSK